MAFPKTKVFREFMKGKKLKKSRHLEVWSPTTFFNLTQSCNEKAKCSDRDCLNNRFLRDKLQFFLRSKQFHGRVTDEDLALALLTRSQSSSSSQAPGGLQNSLQVEQLLNLVQLAQ